MTAYVVDTNVPVVANGDHPQAREPCVQACVLALRDIATHGMLVLDDKGCILGEYRDNLRSSGQPGPGDAFFKWAWDNQGQPERCEPVPITPVNGTFREFPDDPALARFHPDDRKFVAVALASQHGPEVLNAVDSDWWQFQDALRANGVNVHFLCPEQFDRIDD